MIGKWIAASTVFIAVLSLLTACGPGASPTPSPSPTEPPSPTLAPTQPPTATPPPSPTPMEPGGGLSYQDGFEEGLEGWQRGSDVPEDPDRPGEPVFWEIDISDEQVAGGVTSARFTLDGKQDDGTIWLARPFDAGAEGVMDVHLRFDLWSASESFNTLAKVAAYAGPQPPERESDFDLTEAANQVEGWRTYDYRLQAAADEQGQIWVALGISAVWETEMTYFVDDVRVEIAPSDEGQPPSGNVTVTGVNVTDVHVAVRGESTLPDGSCVNAELWADGVLQAWWPSDACAPVQNGRWELLVPVDAGQELEPGVQYVVRAYQPGGPQIVSTFAFDLSGPATPPGQPAEDDPTLILPESAEPLHRASADLDGDGQLEEVVLTGWGGGADQLGYDFLQMFVIALEEGGDYVIAWQSEQLPTDRAEALDVRDLNDDGLPEVLSVQAMGASGETLYVLGWKGSQYGWYEPQGGRFGGQDSFGENGARVEDVDGDSLLEILGSYGPAAAFTDVYAWDGEAYVYRETMEEAEGGFEQVVVADAGLSLEVPSGWTSTAPGRWSPPGEPELRLGVDWVDLEPPQEPEAALLPQPAQIVASEPVETPLGAGRRFRLEVYGEAPEGDEQAPVETLEVHVLVVVDEDEGRRAFDFFVSAASSDDLAALEEVLQLAVESAALE